MYSGNFSSIKTVSEDMGIQVSDLIRMGFEGELSIYAWKRWFHFDLETPDCRNSVDSPILIDDEKYLAELMNGEGITLHIDSDGRFICGQDATDDNYLDGVKVTQSDLFCLKSEIEELKHKKSVDQPITEAGKVVDTVDPSDDGRIESKKPWLIHNPDDPAPAQPWYTPARHFARELVKKDPTLLLKKDLLAAKVVKLLTSAGIKKRGGKKPFEPGTVLKAFSNITFG